MSNSSKNFDYKAFNEFRKTPEYWGLFDAANGQHKYILALLHTSGWIVHKGNRTVADMVRFGEWLQSEKSPVQKPLKKMTTEETSKIIVALENMV